MTAAGRERRGWWERPDSNGAWLTMRGVGLLESLDDVKQIVIGASCRIPVYVGQVADVVVP